MKKQTKREWEKESKERTLPPPPISFNPDLVLSNSMSRSLWCLAFCSPSCMRADTEGSSSLSPPPRHSGVNLSASRIKCWYRFSLFLEPRDNISWSSGLQTYRQKINQFFFVTSACMLSWEWGGGVWRWGWGYREEERWETEGRERVSRKIMDGRREMVRWLEKDRQSKNKTEAEGERETDRQRHRERDRHSI